MNRHTNNSGSAVMGWCVLAYMLAAWNHTQIDICGTSHHMGSFSEIK